MAIYNNRMGQKKKVPYRKEKYDEVKNRADRRTKKNQNWTKKKKEKKN